MTASRTTKSESFMRSSIHSGRAARSPVATAMPAARGPPAGARRARSARLGRLGRVGSTPAARAGPGCVGEVPPCGDLVAVVLDPLLVAAESAARSCAAPDPSPPPALGASLPGHEVVLVLGRDDEFHSQPFFCDRRHLDLHQPVEVLAAASRPSSAMYCCWAGSSLPWRVEMFDCTRTLLPNTARLAETLGRDLRLTRRCRRGQGCCGPRSTCRRRRGEARSAGPVAGRPDPVCSGPED